MLHTSPSGSVPANTKIGKYQHDGMMVGGKAVFSPVAQIFLECWHCPDTIAIIPTGDHRNDVVDSISNEEAVAVFEAHGWKVLGHNSKETICPNCLTLTTTV